MNIAFFMAPLLNHGGGAEKYFITMANEMVRRGHKISIVNLNELFYKKLTFLLSIYYASKLGSVRYTDEDIEGMLKNVDWIRVRLKDLRKNLQGFDVIYTKNEILDLGILRLVGFKNLPPVIASIETPIYYPITASLQGRLHNLLYSSFIYKNLVESCVAIRVSNSEDEVLARERYHKHVDSIYKIYYPLDTRFLEAKKGKEDQFLNILFVGRLTEQKGIDILVEIIKGLSVKPIFKDLHFTIVGSGGMDNKVKSLDSKFENVNYLGHIPSDQIPEVYSSNDILIAPSRYETLHWVSLEAQACSLPVIVSDIPGPRDIIIDGKTGFLVENKPENFIDKIEYFYNLKRYNPEKFSEFCREARKHILEKFRPHLIFDQLEEMFEKVKNVR